MCILFCPYFLEIRFNDLQSKVLSLLSFLSLFYFQKKWVKMDLSTLSVSLPIVMTNFPCCSLGQTKKSVATK